MKALYVAALLLLASCAHPNTPPPPQSEPVGLDTPPPLPPSDKEFVRVDSDNPAENGPSRGVVVQTARSWLDRLTGRTPPPRYYPPGTPVVAGKKSTITINHVAGNQSNAATTVGKKATAATGEGAVASVTGKKSGPAVIASDSSTLNAIEGGGNLAAVNGDGNALEQTKQDVTTEAPGIGATIAQKLAGPPGIVLGIALAGGLIYLVIIWRKKKAAQNLV